MPSGMFREHVHTAIHILDATVKSTLTVRFQLQFAACCSSHVSGETIATQSSPYAIHTHFQTPPELIAIGETHFSIRAPGN